MNLQWEYNNIQIKERNEWKAVFTTSKGLFEPIVMFFGLTNLLVTFQIIMNEILRGLINTGKMTSFIDNIIIKIEEEKEYNKLVEEVVKILAENNLYMKLKKCKQKVKEVGFLEVVIELEGIKMEKEKMKGILDQLISKYVKNIQKFLELVNYYH